MMGCTSRKGRTEHKGILIARMKPLEFCWKKAVLLGILMNCDENNYCEVCWRANRPCLTQLHHLFVNVAAVGRFACKTFDERQKSNRSFVFCVGQGKCHRERKLLAKAHKIWGALSPQGAQRRLFLERQACRRQRGRWISEIQGRLKISAWCIVAYSSGEVATIIWTCISICSYTYCSVALELDRAITTSNEFVYCLGQSGTEYCQRGFATMTQVTQSKIDEIATTMAKQMIEVPIELQRDMMKARAVKREQLKPEIKVAWTARMFLVKMWKPPVHMV